MRLNSICCIVSKTLCHFFFNFLKKIFTKTKYNFNTRKTVLIALLTLHIIVCFSTSDPLSALKAPVIRVSQNNFHEDIVMRCEVESSDVETEEWKHPSGGKKQIQQQGKFVSFQCKRHKIAKQNFIDKRLHGLNWPELFNRACCCFFADLNIHIFLLVS